MSTALIVRFAFLSILNLRGNSAEGTIGRYSIFYPKGSFDSPGIYSLGDFKLEHGTICGWRKISFLKALFNQDLGERDLWIGQGANE